MDKKLRYTTLKGLIGKCKQFSYSNYLSGRMLHINKGWVRFSVAPEVRQQIEDLFKSVVGDIDLNINSNYGLFERLIITKRLTGQYIAGQEYSSELRYLKQLIKRG